MNGRTILQRLPIPSKGMILTQSDDKATTNQLIVSNTKLLIVNIVTRYRGGVTIRGLRPVYHPFT